MASTDPTVLVLKRTPHTHTNALTKQKEFGTYVQPDKKIIGYLPKIQKIFLGGLFFCRKSVADRIKRSEVKIQKTRLVPTFYFYRTYRTQDVYGVHIHCCTCTLNFKFTILLSSVTPLWSHNREVRRNKVYKYKMSCHTTCREGYQRQYIISMISFWWFLVAVIFKFLTFPRMWSRIHESLFFFLFEILIPSPIFPFGLSGVET
jgi:hypothetical protein